MGSQDERVPERSSTYEPPRVEQVLTPTELEEEILYAGATTADN